MPPAGKLPPQGATGPRPASKLPPQGATGPRPASKLPPQGATGPKQPTRGEATGRKQAPRGLAAQSGRAPFPWRWVVGVVLLGGVVAAVILVTRMRTEERRSGTNMPPVMQTVELKQHGGNIVVTPRAFDREGNPIYYKVVWSVNDKVLDDHFGLILPSTRYRPGAKVEATVTPSDRWGEGRAMRTYPLLTR